MKSFILFLIGLILSVIFGTESALLIIFLLSIAYTIVNRFLINPPPNAKWYE